MSHRFLGVWGGEIDPVLVPDDDHMDFGFERVRLRIRSPVRQPVEVSEATNARVADRG